MLFELVFTSYATFSLSDQQLDGLLDRARFRNKALDVTGALLFDGERYIQLLEGNEENVRAIFKDIDTDMRHCCVTMLHTGKIKHRKFAKWPLAYQSHQRRNPADHERIKPPSLVEPGAIDEPSLGLRLMSVLAGNRSERPPHRDTRFDA